KGDDIFGTTEWTFLLCDELGYEEVCYDADGLGAGVRGDARVINERRVKQKLKIVRLIPFRGSTAGRRPDKPWDKPPTPCGDNPRPNKDMVANRKAQGWWSLRQRAYKTFRWVTQKIECSPDEILSISTKCDGWEKLLTEMSQATMTFNG